MICPGQTNVCIYILIVQKRARMLSLTEKKDCFRRSIIGLHASTSGDLCLAKRDKLEGN